MTSISTWRDLLLDDIENIVHDEAMRLHADRVDHGVWANATRHLHERLPDVGLFKIDDLGTELLRQLQPVRVVVDADQPSISA